MLAGGDRDIGAFATLESDLDSEESVASRYTERSGGRRVGRLIDAGTNGRNNLGVRGPAIAERDWSYIDTTHGGSEGSYTDTTHRGSEGSYTDTTRGGSGGSKELHATERAEREIYPFGTTGRHHAVSLSKIPG